jgi:hypothetical protein
LKIKKKKRKNICIRRNKELILRLLKREKFIAVLKGEGIRNQREIGKKRFKKKIKKISK